MGILGVVKDATGKTIVRIPFKEELRMKNKDAVDTYIKNEIRKAGYLLRDDVLRILRIKYEVDISGSTLKYYSLKKMIKPGINCKVDHLKGSVSLYAKNTTKIIALIKYLQDKKGYKLVELERYFGILCFYNIEKLKEFYNAINQENIVTMQGSGIRFGKLAGELMCLQEIAIYRALLELNLFNKTFNEIYPDPDTEVNIIKNSRGKYNVIVNFPKHNKEVVYAEEGIKISK